MSKQLLLFFTAVLLGLSLPGRCAFSGLAIIPTADVVPHGQYVVALQDDGVMSGMETDAFLLDSEIGIGDRFETGLDYDLTDSLAIFNAKYVALTNHAKTQALAVGVSNVANGEEASPYLVGTTTLPAFRLHGGLWRLEDKIRPFVGIDRNFSSRLNLSADYTGGDENYTSVGINYQFSCHLGVFAGILYPHAGGDTEFELFLNFAGPYCGKPTEK